MKRRLALLSMPVALGIAALALVPGEGGAQQATGERTISLVEKGASQFAVVDNPPRDIRKHGPSAGDMFVFTRSLYDESAKKVGGVTAKCTVTPVRTTTLCEGVFALADGSIFGSGLSKDSSLKTVIAISGGTGAYEGARGTITTVNRSHANNAPADDTIHLLG
jgi:hypothetical protein